MWKKCQNLLSNNNDPPASITKYGYLVRPHARIVALHLHCARTALSAPPLGENEPPPGGGGGQGAMSGGGPDSELGILKLVHRLQTG